MIRHIVMWKLNEEGKEENAKKIKENLEALVGKVDGLISLEVRPTIKGDYDLCLLSMHENYDKYLAYRENPLHKAAQKIVHASICDRVSCDVEMD